MKEVLEKIYLVTACEVDWGNETQGARSPAEKRMLQKPQRAFSCLSTSEQAAALA